MDVQTTAHLASTDLTDRVVYLLRRFVAWFLDGLVIAVPLLAIGLAAFFFSWAMIGGSFALAGGGLEGMLAGSAVGALTTLLVLLVIPVVLISVPAFYLRWAAHRQGPHAGQTFGQQLFDLRVVRSGADPRPVRGRTMIGRAVLMYVVLVALSIVPSAVEAATSSSMLMNLVWMVLVGAMLWRAVDGRLPHDRASGTRMADLSDDTGGWDAAR